MASPHSVKVPEKSPENKKTDENRPTEALPFGMDDPLIWEVFGSMFKKRP